MPQFAEVSTQSITMDSGQGVIEIEKVTSEKDLGVIVDEALNFSEHISTKDSKANRILGIIFRTLLTWIKKCSYLYVNCTIPSRIRRKCMFTSIQKGYDRNRKRPEENHKFSVSSIRQLSHQKKLKNLGLPLFEYMRERADLIEVYKIMNNVDQIEKDKLFTVSIYHVSCMSH